MLSLFAALSSFALAAPLECAPRAEAHPSTALAPFWPSGKVDSALVALYESGETFASFLAHAKARKAMWDRHWSEGAVAPDVLERARGIPGRWRLLVVAVDACSDSVNTIPFLAHLEALVPGIEMRIVTPRAGREVQRSHRTPDGRSATPTVILLDEQGNDAGCWVERPSELQASFIAAKAADKIQEWADQKQAWYDQDAGASTIREVVTMIEAAVAGTPLCGSGAPPATTP